MPSNDVSISHRIAGGLASDFGTTARVQPEVGGVDIPFLVEAKDIFYTLDGGFRKVGGSKIVSTGSGSSASVDSLYDYWFSVSGTPMQQLISYAGKKIFADYGTGTGTVIKSDMSANGKLHFSQFDEDLIITSSITNDVPLVYNGSTIETLGTNAPNGQFSAVFKNKLWMAGDPENPSRLYYSLSLPDGPRGDWLAEGAGTIDINPGDGDEIRGLVSYKDNLWVFKGPNRGSIHRIEGNSPADFARRDFLDAGLPAVAPNGFFLFQDDLGWITADGEVHGLKATASYGDFNESSLTRPISKLIQSRVNRSALFRSDAVSWSSRGLVLFSMPFDGSDKPNFILSMDHRFGAPRWATWEDYDVRSIANVIDVPAKRSHTVFLGGSTTNVVRRIDTGDTANETDTPGTYTAITGRVRTPYLGYGGARERFNLSALSVVSEPDGISTVTVAWSRDGKPTQSETLPAQGGDLLGSTFVVGSSILGRSESRARHRRTETGGEFNQIQFEISNGVLTTATEPETGQSMRINAFEALLSRSAESLEN